MAPGIDAESQEGPRPADAPLFQPYILHTHCNTPEITPTRLPLIPAGACWPPLLSVCRPLFPVQEPRSSALSVRSYDTAYQPSGRPSQSSRRLRWHSLRRVSKQAKWREEWLLSDGMISGALEVQDSEPCPLRWLNPSSLGPTFPDFDIMELSETIDLIYFATLPPWWIFNLISSTVCPTAAADMGSPKCCPGGALVLTVYGWLTCSYHFFSQGIQNSYQSQWMSQSS